MRPLGSGRGGESLRRQVVARRERLSGDAFFVFRFLFFGFKFFGAGAGVRISRLGGIRVGKVEGEWVEVGVGEGLDEKVTRGGGDASDEGLGGA